MLRQSLIQVRKKLQALAALGPRVYDGRYQALIQEECEIKNQLNNPGPGTNLGAEQNDFWGNGK